MKTTDGSKVATKPKSAKPANKPIVKPIAKPVVKIEAKPIVPITPVIVQKKPQTPVEAVIDKYRSNGWVVISVQGVGLNDIIAQKQSGTNRLHFIQVVTDDQAAKHNGNAKNDFIQNAFSNQAVPVYAYVEQTKDKSPIITFEDVNLCSRVIIGHTAKTQVVPK